MASHPTMVVEAPVGPRDVIVVATEPFAVVTLTKLTFPFVPPAVPIFICMSPDALLVDDPVSKVRPPLAPDDDVFPVFILIPPVSYTVPPPVEIVTAPEFIAAVPVDSVSAPEFPAAVPEDTVTDPETLDEESPDAIVTAPVAPDVPTDPKTAVDAFPDFTDTVLLSVVDRDVPVKATVPPANVAEVLPPNEDVIPVTVTFPALPIKITSAPRAFTRKGLAVDKASVAICTKSCAVVPFVDAEVSPMVNAVCEAVVCAQFHTIGLFPLAMVADPPAAVTLLSVTVGVAHAASVVDDATSTCPDVGAVDPDTETVVVAVLIPLAAVAVAAVVALVAFATVPVVATSVESPVGNV